MDAEENFESAFYALAIEYLKLAEWVDKQATANANDKRHMRAMQAQDTLEYLHRQVGFTTRESFADALRAHMLLKQK